VRGKIGVYGRSLGGITTTHLADKVDFIIADRTFCNFESLAKRKFYSKLSHLLFKAISCNWVANNDINILKKGLGTCYKVIITDKNDEVIDL
jgi:formate/nitrite transporter FocA (FNT family)